MKTMPPLAALAVVFLLAGCGEQKSDSAIKTEIEKSKAEAEARMAALRERAETASATAERDSALEAKAAEIEAAFEADMAIVEAARKEANAPEQNDDIRIIDTSHGFCSKTVSLSRSRLGEDENAQETTVYSVRLPDGTEWTAEVVRENGIVTKAVREKSTP